MKPTQHSNALHCVCSHHSPKVVLKARLLDMISLWLLQVTSSSLRQHLPQQ